LEKEANQICILKTVQFTKHITPKKQK